MRDRVARLGGRLDVVSDPGVGTTITATVPVGASLDQEGAR
jgi:signal transduction histidine kinase